MERFGTVAIVGVGLIGGSIGLTLRKRALADRVIGIGRSLENLADAVRLGAIDLATTDLAEGVSLADVVVVCTPVTEIVATVLAAANSSSRALLITDAGSTKRGIVEAVERDGRARGVFVGAHPIAGSERKGAVSASLGLFDERVCVVTPTENTPASLLESAIAFWRGVGCRVVELDPASHDEFLAFTSHLPHAVAAALAATIPPDALGLAAGAYRDGTRVALSDAKLWSGIFRANRQPLLKAIDGFQQQITTLRQLIEKNDDDLIVEWWNSARTRRIRFQELGEGIGG